MATNVTGYVPAWKMNFREAMDAIYTELVYQDNKWPRQKNDEPTVGEAIVLLEQYVHQAVSLWTSEKGNIASLHEIRKVAAIAVRALANHGVVQRLTEEGARIRE